MSGGFAGYVLFPMCLVLCVLLMSYAGAFHPLGDSLAVFRLPIAVLAAVFALFVLFGGGGAWGIAGLLAAAFAIGPILLAKRPVPAVEGYALYQKNIMAANWNYTEILEDILAVSADFVTLEEVHDRHRGILDDLAEMYPYQSFCPFASVGGVAVLSRWPLAEGGAVCDRTALMGFTALQADTPDGPLWVGAVHLHWPWPFDQGPQVARIAQAMEALDGPMAFAGDLNMVPWAWAPRRLAQAAGAERIGRVEQTLRLGRRNMPRLPIDHVFVPQGWQGSTERRDRLGSDHYGIVGHFRPPSASEGR